ncbi:Fc.00g098810.m01.CDS01 [Cosmosporella sp. VM-42]
MSSSNFVVDDAFIATVVEHIKVYMANYDGSHDYSHIQRVLRLALYIQSHNPHTSREIVILCALLHDVGDRKYLKPGEDPSLMVYTYLRSLGAPDMFASKIQTICVSVSYSSEIKDPAKVVALIEEHPELAIVQDADRLDAIGAVGIGRCFAYGGAKGRGMGDTMEHFEEKLVKLEGMMKTDVGRELARVRTERIRKMMEWWALETGEDVEATI